MSLATLSGKLVAILQAHRLCQQIKIVETKTFSLEQYFIKIRVQLPKEHKLQVCVYHNWGHIDYAYQLFSNVPLLRWDNKEEFPHLNTYPHHHHDDLGNIIVSPLKGNPIKDIEIVLAEITKFMAKLN